MNKSESIANLAKALASAQMQMGPALKDKANPFFKSTYSDLASVTSAIREPLASNGLSYVQVMAPTEGNEVSIETVLMHESGEWISSVTVIPVTKADAQGYGSAITYAKRYGLQGMVGCPSDDDDGNAAAKAKPEPRIQLPKLSDEESAQEYMKWVQIKSLLVDENGDQDHERVTEEWGKLPSNVRSAIKRYGESTGES